jgi:hypothetical protein
LLIPTGFGGARVDVHAASTAEPSPPTRKRKPT